MIRVLVRLPGVVLQIIDDVLGFIEPAHVSSGFNLEARNLSLSATFDQLLSKCRVLQDVPKLHVQIEMFQ